MLKSLFRKNRRRTRLTGTPSSNSLNFSISDSENSYKMEMLEVSNELTSIGQKADHVTVQSESAPVMETDDAGDAPSADDYGADVEESAESDAETEADKPTNEKPRPIGAIDNLIPSSATSQSGRRSRRTTFGTTSEPDDSPQSQARREKEAAMIRLWQRANAPKKVPFPSRYPGYLKEPLVLSYEETLASIQRRAFNDMRIKSMTEKAFKRDESRVKQLSPKMNKTMELRSKYIRREPLVSRYFADHYNRHRKPPFKNTNVKYHN